MGGGFDGMGSDKMKRAHIEGKGEWEVGSMRETKGGIGWVEGEMKRDKRGKNEEL